ncbi:retention module-containing protein [Chitinibacter sp. S2-10]|uniref:retention module-containing protein n=1 Tax=Chitinibacter sp. S2-10 TaxID=3373597 RepID=UPI003977284A
MAETVISSAEAQKIVVVEGEAFIRDASGKVTPIAAGQQLQEGQVIFTSATGHVTLLLPNGQVIEVGADRSLLLDGDLAATQPTDATEAKVANTDTSANQIINALNQNTDLNELIEAPAAGLNGAGPEGEGSGFVRLLRIAEQVDPISFDFATTLARTEPVTPASSGEATPQSGEVDDGTDPGDTGSNNVPQGNDVSVTTTEDTPVSGQLVAQDPDGDTLVYTPNTQPGHGSVVVNKDGSWTYTPSQDYNGSDSFTVTVTDGKGGSDTLTIKIGVTPVNDSATIAGQDSGAVTEDSNVQAGNTLQIGGQLTVSDPDGAAEENFQPQTNTPGTYGSLSIDSTGAWSYTANNGQSAIQSLDDGGSLTDTFTVQSADGTTHSIVITINGQNDAPVPSAATLSVKENDPVANGQLVASDVDTNDQGKLSFATGSNIPGLVLNSNGSYSFDATDPAYNSLKEGEVQTITVPYSVTDGTATSNSTLTITVVGTNDKPVVQPPVPTPGNTPVNVDPATGDYLHSVPEDTVVNGKVIASDADNDTLSYSAGTAPSHGSVTIDQNTGAYVYTPSANYNGNDSFTVLIDDGNGGTTTATIKIELTPVGNPATIAGQDSGAVTEDSNVQAGNTLQIGGQLTVSDVDGAAEENFQPQTNTPGTYGSLSIDSTGAWSYTANNGQSAIQSLDDGGSLTDTFTVQSADGTTHSIVITIHGQNDAPVPTAATLSVKENDPVANGQLVASDVDTNDQGKLSFATGSNIPGLVLNSNGSYSFDATDPAYNSLKEGEVQTITVPYSVTDGTATSNSTLTITVVGTNDKPVVQPPVPTPGNTPVNVDPATGDYLHSVPEDTVVNGKVIASDADNDTLSYSTGSAPSHGSVTIDAATGAYVYTPSANYNGNDSFTVLINDGNGGTTTATIKIELTPVGNPATIAGQDSGAVTEDSNVQAGNTLQIGGQLTVSDPDGAAEENFQPQTNTPGTYGSLSIDSTGAWSYTANNGQSAIQSLDDGGSLTDTFTVQSADGTTHSIVITINGQNDAPVPSAATLSVKENDPVANGQLVASDVDTNDQGKLSFATGSNIPGLVLNSNGSYSFDATDPAYNSLKEGEVQTITVPYSVTDGTATSNSTLTITVVGTNDKPVVQPPVPTPGNTPVNVDPATGDYLHSVPEDTVVNGKVIASDADNDTLSYSAGTAPSHGSVTIDQNTGAYVYTPSANYNGNDSFTVLIDDGNGGTTTATIKIELTPVGNPATIAGQDSGAVTEDSNVQAGNTLQIGGQLTVSDVDGAAEENFQPQTNTPGTYGSLSIDSTGAWSYTANNGQSAIQSLDDGGSLTDTFTVQSADGTTHSIVITIHGQNDAPVPTAATLSVKENDPVANGQLVASDVDTNDQGKLSFATGSNIPGLVLNSNGSYSFDATDPAYNSLKEGEVQTITVPYSVTDGTATSNSTLTITVVGTNDKPVVQPPVPTPGNTPVNVDPATGDYLHSVPEDTVVNGKVIASDADNDTLSYSTGSAPSHGSVTIDAATGAYVYTPSANYNGNDSFTVLIDDGNGGTTTATIKIELTPVGNPATIAGQDSGAVTEDSNVQAGNTLQIGGQLTVSDVDGAAEENFQPQTNTPGTYGSLSIDSTGAWSYTANNGQSAIQSLDDGGSLTDTFTVQSADGTTHSIVITIHGQNDAPVPTAATLSVKENDPVANGQLVASDVDTNDQGKLSFATGSNIPGLVLNSNGSYSFDATDPAYNSLKEGEVQTITVPYSVTDGTATSNSTLTITVVGTNDKPVVQPPVPTPGNTPVNVDPATGDYLHSVPEDTVVNGKVIASDADNDTLSYSAGTAPSHGSVTIDQNTGAYVYTPSANYNGNDSFTVLIDDGNGGTTTATIKIELTPVGNPATIAGQDSGAVTEDSNVQAGNTLQIGGQLTVSDPDGAAEENFQPQTNTPGTYGSLSIDSTGAWSYTANNGQSAIQSLDDGGSLTDTFTVQSADGTTHSIVITINGQNDAPVPSAATLSVKENDPVANGQLVASDVDTNDQGKLSFATGSNIPGLVLNSNGSYSFDATDPAYNSLKEGEVQTITVPYSVTDGTATSNSTLTITVVGTNDKPVVQPPVPTPGNTPVNVDPATGDYLHSVPEDTVVNGKVIASDADNDTLSYSAGTAPSHGSVTIDQNTGAYVYTPSANYNGNDSFTVLIDDGNGGTTTATIKIELTPVGNPATIAGQDSGAVTEDSNVQAGNTLQIGGQLTVSDVDGAAEENFQPQTNTPGTYGSLSIDSTGAWSYTANNGQSAIQSLDDGGSLTDTFTVQSADGTTHSIVITIHGQNDAPVPTAATLSVKENDPVANGQLVASDVDTNDQGKLSFATGSNIPGLVLNSNGSYSFDATDPAYNSLKEGEVQTITVPYSVTDGTATSNSTLTITVVGTNDKPVVQPPVPTPGNTPVNVDPATGDYLHSVPEDTVVNGKVIASDADNDTLSYSTGSAPSHGSVTIDAATGAYVYTPSANYNGNDSFTVLIDDGNGGTTTATIKIELTPVGNPATIAGQDSGAVTEDSNVQAGNTLQIGGQLTVSDVDGAAEENFQPQTNTPGTYGSLSIDSTGAWSYTANNGQSAIQSLDDGGSLTDTFTVQSADGTTHSIVITIHGQNDAPVPTAATLSVKENDPVANGQLVASDVDTNDQGKLSFATGSNIPGLVLNSNGSYSFDATDPAYNSLKEGEVQTITVPYSVTDGTATSNSTLTITVVGTNDKPVVQPPVPTPGNTPVNVDPATGDYLHSVPEDTVVNGKVIASDADNDTLSYSTGSAPSHGSVTIDAATGAYVYTPSANYNGNDSFTVLINDGNGGTTTATIKIELTPVNDAPVTNNTSASGNEDTLIAVSLSGSDVDGSVASFKLTSLPTNGTFYSDAAGTQPLNATSVIAASNNGATIYFKPNADWNGNATFEYTATDNQGLSDATPANGTITVNAVNDAPVTNNTSASGNEDTLIAVSLSGSDVDGSVASFKLTSLPTNGSFYSDAAGTQPLNAASVIAASNNGATIYFKPNADWNGNTSFQYTAIDNNGLSDATPASGTITVNPLNDAPLGVADQVNANEGKTTTFTSSVLGNDTDIDSSASSLKVIDFSANSSGTAAQQADGAHTITTALGGTVTMNQDGTFSYVAPVRNHADTTPDQDSFYYRANDGSASSAWTKVTIDIADSTPTAVADTATADYLGVVAGNVLTNDSALDLPMKVSSVTFGGQTYQLPANGSSLVLDTPNGKLTIANDGSYSYQSEVKTVAVDNSSLAQWNADVGLYGQTSSAWHNADGSLNIGGLGTAGQNVNLQGGTGKVGLGVGQAKGINGDEALVMDFKTDVMQAHVTLAQFNGGQSNAKWFAYDSEGNLVASGNFMNTSSNGSPVLQEVTADLPFHYLVVQYTDPSNQGYVVTGLSYDLAPSTMSPEVVTYTAKDQDGSSVNSTLTLGVALPNTAPVAVDDYTYTKTGQSVTYNVIGNDHDAQNDTLSIFGTPVATNGTVTVNPNGTLTFVPTAGFTGDATVTYSISDGRGGVDTAVWTIKVVDGSNVFTGGEINDTFTAIDNSVIQQTPAWTDYSKWFVTNNPADIIYHPGVDGTTNTSGNDQVFVTNSSNDFIEAGNGNDLMFLGETQPNNTGDQSQAFILADGLMTVALGANDQNTLMLNTKQQLSAAAKTSAEWADIAHGGAGNDTMFGEGGTDMLFGGTGDDKLYGGTAADGLRGGEGHDLLNGGAGNDVLRGDSGSDVFKWTLGDQGTAGTPARDIVMDFNRNGLGRDGTADADKLDLRDLLQGENSGNLTQYLHFEKSGSDTIVHISSGGKFASGDSDLTIASKENQVITLQGIDLTTVGNDQAIIADLLNKGRLITD